MMPRPIHALINLSALKHNLSIVRSYTPHARIMVVLKADAYGHGLIPTAKALNKADGFALLELDAAIRLREAGFQQPILLLEGFFSTEEIPLFEKYQLSTVIHNKEQLAMLSTCEYKGLDIFIKINSGMNRLGFAPEEFPHALKTLTGNSGVNKITLMTHFANADNPTENDNTNNQIECFNTTTAGINLPRSLANSAAIIRYPEAHADWVRPGIMLYGASPFTDITASELGLQPVMTVTSKLIAIQNLKAGDKVGYASTFQAKIPIKIGIVAAGYADGYPRHAFTETPIVVNEQLTRTLGRVSMDMLAVDLSHIENAKLGDSVTLWGKGLSVDEVARSADTISYELLCGLAPRVDKTYK
jgi:alanine racemase